MYASCAYSNMVSNLNAKVSDMVSTFFEVSFHVCGIPYYPCLGLSPTRLEKSDLRRQGMAWHALKLNLFGLK